MTVLYSLRHRLARFICPEMGAEARLKAARAAGCFDVDVAEGHERASPTICPVEVQTEPDGPWRSAEFIDGRLHWVPGPIGTTGAAYLAAVCAEYARANREVPAAIAAALVSAAPQSPDAEVRRASQAPRDDGSNAGEAMLRCRFPRSDQQGAS